MKNATVAKKIGQQMARKQSNEERRAA